MGIGLANPNSGSTPVLMSGNPTVTSSPAPEPEAGPSLQVEPEEEPEPELNNDIEGFHETINASPLIGLAGPGSQ